MNRALPASLHVFPQALAGHSRLHGGGIWPQTLLRIFLKRKTIKKKKNVKCSRSKSAALSERFGSLPLLTSAEFLLCSVGWEGAEQNPPNSCKQHPHSPSWSCPLPGSSAAPANLSRGSFPETEDQPSCSWGLRSTQQDLRGWCSRNGSAVQTLTLWDTIPHNSFPSDS